MTLRYDDAVQCSAGGAERSLYLFSWIQWLLSEDIDNYKNIFDMMLFTRRSTVEQLNFTGFIRGNSGVLDVFRKFKK